MASSSFNNANVKHGVIHTNNQHLFEKQTEAPALDVPHTIVFHIVQHNLDQLEARLNDVSSPSSPNYGKHMTKAEIDALVANEPGFQVLSQFLQEHQVEFTSSKDHLVVTATASLQQWQQLLQCEFFVYLNPKTQVTVVRTPEYFLPESVAGQVQYVDGLVNFPVEITHHGDNNNNNNNNNIARPAIHRGVHRGPALG